MEMLIVESELTNAIGEDHAPAEDEADKLSDADVAIHIGRPRLGHTGPKLGVAQTWSRETHD